MVSIIIANYQKYDSNYKLYVLPHN